MQHRGHSHNAETHYSPGVKHVLTKVGFPTKFQTCPQHPPDAGKPGKRPPFSEITIPPLTRGTASVCAERRPSTSTSKNSPMGDICWNRVSWCRRKRYHPEP